VDKNFILQIAAINNGINQPERIGAFYLPPQFFFRMLWSIEGKYLRMSIFKT